MEMRLYERHQYVVDFVKECPHHCNISTELLQLIVIIRSLVPRRFPAMQVMTRSPQSGIKLHAAGALKVMTEFASDDISGAVCSAHLNELCVILVEYVLVPPAQIASPDLTLCVHPCALQNKTRVEKVVFELKQRCREFFKNRLSGS